MKKKYVLRKEIKTLLNKLLLTIVIFLIGMILVKGNPKLKKNIKQTFYENSLSIMKYKKVYAKYFGNFLESNKLISKEIPVSTTKLSFKNKESFHNGVKLQVIKNYSVPVLESGVIVFIGNKDNLKNTIVIEQTDGINTSYASIINSNYKLYDYVEKGEILGQVEKDNLYLKFQKDGKNLDYHKYL